MIILILGTITPIELSDSINQYASKLQFMLGYAHYRYNLKDHLNEHSGIWSFTMPVACI